MTEEFVEEIEKQIQKRTTFTVSGILVDDLKEFKEYCKKECGDNYSIGIVQLLHAKKQYEQFISLFSSLQNKIDQIQTQLNRQEEKKPFKTFG